uniref:protein ALP1-like n=1 Tax=Erigeron canadensis TaxID=72917 RepID=UPI001CB98FF1|nr:protein ALP1-like [Erigeron canadensis]
MGIKYDISCLNVIFDEEENQHQEASSSSRPKFTRRVISRDHVGAGKLLYDHYFAPNCTYPPDMFRRRFRMRQDMFLCIVRDINSFQSIEPLPKHFQFFHKGATDATGRPSFNIFQKCTSAIRQLAYSFKADALDEYLQMAQDTGYQCLDAFCKCVIQLYQQEYLRRPIEADVERLTAKHEQVHGFPGMLGSIDCMHWVWRNCPVAWQGQYTRGDKGHPTIMLEAVASYDLWIWHAYFGPAGSNNDINVLNGSDLFDDLLQDRAPKVEFSVNGEQFTKGYYLADGIYPEWATLVKSFKCPMDAKTTKFKRYQEAARKDVERAFGVLQGRWQIIEQYAQPYSTNKIKRIMLCCVILHNMIVEDNGRAITEFEEELIANTTLSTRTWTERCSTQLRMYGELRDRIAHHSLRNDLIEHVWNLPEHGRQR